MKEKKTEKGNSVHSRGRGLGACECVVNGQEGVPDANKAEALCHELGYARLVGFTHGESERGSLLCSGQRGGCFRNRNPGNLICTSITCARR